MTNEINNSTNKQTSSAYSTKINLKTLTWTIFSYLGAIVFLGFAIWSIYYFSLPNNAKDLINELHVAGNQSLADFVKVWQYTFFPWCLFAIVCIILAATGTVKLKNTSVGRLNKKNPKKTLSC